MTAPLTIDNIYAFVTKDEDGNEGICGYKSIDGWLPLIGADEGRVDSLIEMAQIISNRTGISIELCSFELRKEIKTIEPEAKG